jgi:hypothetical protein
MQERFVVMTADADGKLWGRTRIVDSRVEAVRLVDERRGDRPLDDHSRAEVVRFLEGGPTEGARWISSYGPDGCGGGLGDIYGCILPITG